MLLKIKENLFIIISIIVGFVLRFTISYTHSFSSDELSAINRLRQDGLLNILDKAIKIGDMHPAGVQLFEEFWSSMFGTSELILRLPFVLLGTLSIFITYYIGKSYISKQTGVISSLLLSITYFPILQSELARPYSPGLFFSLLVTLFTLKVLFPRNKTSSRKWINSIILGISFTMTMYTHYFAFMYVAFIGITGLFFLSKKNYIQFITSGFIAIILFLPHLNITIYHLTIDGGLQWLGKPSAYWLVEFIFYALNDSIIFVITLIIIILTILIKRNYLSNNLNKFVLLFGFWFFGIYIIGYLFSLYSSPILKFPVMLFPLPMLFLVISSFIPKIKLASLRLIYMILFSIGIYSTIFEKNLYSNEHFGVFKELIKPISIWKEQFGSDNIDIYMNVSNPYYLNYYAKQFNDSLVFKVDNMEFDSDKTIRHMLKNSQKEYCIIGYSARLTLPQIFETCKEFYPKIIDFVKLKNCAVFILAKESKDEFVQKKNLISSFNNSIKIQQKEDILGTWKYNKAQITNRISNTYYTSDSSSIYGPDFIFKKEDIPFINQSYLKVDVSIIESDTTNLTITMTARRDGELVLDRNNKTFWIGHDLDTMLKDTKSGYFALKIPSFIKPSDEIQISIWNRSGKPVKITDIKIYTMNNIWN